jgi:predicted DsbA family dithiol-disulfide isomerase
VAVEFAGRVFFSRRSFLLLPGVGQRPVYDEYVIGHRRAAAQREPDLGFALPTLGQPYPGSSLPPQQLALHVQATDPGSLDLLEDALYRAVFTDLEDVADPEVLRACARRAGVAELEVERALADQSLAAQARREHLEATAQGITGIPAVWIPGGAPLVGAVPIEAYRDALRRATAG